MKSVLAFIFKFHKSISHIAIQFLCCVFNHYVMHLKLVGKILKFLVFLSLKKCRIDLLIILTLLLECINVILEADLVPWVLMSL